MGKFDFHKSFCLEENLLSILQLQYDKNFVANNLLTLAHAQGMVDL